MRGAGGDVSIGRLVLIGFGGILFSCAFGRLVLILCGLELGTLNYTELTPAFWLSDNRGKKAQRLSWIFLKL